MVYVKTKKGLQRAVERKEQEIIVVGELAEKLKPIVKLKNFSKSKMNRAISLISLFDSTPDFISSFGNIGNSLVVLPGIHKMVEVGLTMRNIDSKMIQGFSGAELIIIIMVLTAAGLTIIALLRDYDVDLEMKPLEGVRFRANRTKA